MTAQVGQQVVADSAAPAPDFGLLRAHQQVPVLRRCGAEPCTDCDHDEGPVRRSAVDAVPGLAPPAVHDVLGSAGSPLDAGVRAFMEPRFGQDFSGVRVHTDARAAASAASVRARAYTVGSDIAFAAGAYSPGTAAGRRLLAHELTHTLQQRGGGGGLAPKLEVGEADDPAEHEADHIADRVMRTLAEGPATASDQEPSAGSGAHQAAMETPGGRPSPSLRLRNQIRRQGLSVSRSTGPLVQRDLAGKRTVTEGDFNVNLKTESHKNAKSGMSGTVGFTPSATAPDSASIKLLQIVRLIQSSTGKPYVWTGADADKMKVQTVAAPGVEAGFRVDHRVSAPRTALGDPSVSPYYRTYWPNTTHSQDGSKAGKAVKEASLWDFPGWTEKCKYSFETAAKAEDTGHVYGTLLWGFELTDPPNGKVENEYANGSGGASATFGAAVKAFDKFYRNPGASTAPTK